jgi:uncharacterized YccA/Bax inhibitor family protein
MALFATTTSNPVLRRLTAEAAPPMVVTEPMTVSGTVTKSGILLGLVVAVAAASWWSLGSGYFPAELIFPVMIGSVLIGFGTGLLVAFRPLTAAWAGPIYAVVQGLALGLISAVMNARYAGLPMQAVGLTAGTTLALLVAYRTGLVKVSDRFRAVIVGLTAGVAIFYLIALGIRVLGGYTIPFLVESGPIGIGFSVFVVILAAMNLLVDFRSIEEGVAQRAPAAYEWAFATGITITLVWLYLEILRLLGKLRNR